MSLKRKDVSLFELESISSDKSPLDVKGLSSNITKKEILDYISKSRKSKERK